jgi:hypothetical protein
MDMMQDKDMYKKILESLQMAIRDKLFDSPDDMNPMEKDGPEGTPEVQMELEMAQKEPPAFAAEEEDESPSMDTIKSFLEGKSEKARPEMKGMKIGQTEVEVSPLMKKRGAKKGY